MCLQATSARRRPGRGHPRRPHPAASLESSPRSRVPTWRRAPRRGRAWPWIPSKRIVTGGPSDRGLSGLALAMILSGAAVCAIACALLVCGGRISNDVVKEVMQHQLDHAKDLVKDVKAHMPELPHASFKPHSSGKPHAVPAAKAAEGVSLREGDDDAAATSTTTASAGVEMGADGVSGMGRARMDTVQATPAEPAGEGQVAMQVSEVQLEVAPMRPRKVSEVL